LNESLKVEIFTSDSDLAIQNTTGREIKELIKEIGVQEIFV